MNNAMKSYPIVIVELSAEDGGGYMAFAPDLKGCMADGETKAEALQNAENAIQEWLDECRTLGRKIPESGSAAKKAKSERLALINVVKVMVDSYDDLEGRLDVMERELAELLESAENSSAWARFASITGLYDKDSNGGSKAKASC